LDLSSGLKNKMQIGAVLVGALLALGGTVKVYLAHVRSDAAAAALYQHGQDSLSTVATGLAAEAARLRDATARLTDSLADGALADSAAIAHYRAERDRARILLASALADTTPPPTVPQESAERTLARVCATVIQTADSALERDSSQLAISHGIIASQGRQLFAFDALLATKDDQLTSSAAQITRITASEATTSTLHTVEMIGVGVIAAYTGYRVGKAQ
jgi:hypothetical protein